MKKGNEKKINPKNYIYSILILIGSILLTLYIFEWYKVKKEERLLNSYLISTKTTNLHITNLDMLKEIRQEAPSSYFIYISYTGDEDIYKFEKKLKRVIDKYKINDIFYYVDITDIKNENYISNLNQIFDTNRISKIPIIIFVNEGIIDDNNIIYDSINDLETLLNNNDYEIIK